MSTIPTYFQGRPVLDVQFGRCRDCFEYVTTLLLGGVGFDRQWLRTEDGHQPHNCLPVPSPTREAA